MSTCGLTRPINAGSQASVRSAGTTYVDAPFKLAKSTSKGGDRTAGEGLIWVNPRSFELEEYSVITARDIMTENVECARSTDTLVDVARKLRDLDVGALPICGEDDRLQGMITDRDIVVKCIADGGDPSSVTASDLAEGKPITIGADDSVHEALRTMSEHGVRRLPVIDGHDLVGVVSQADIAKNLPDESVADLVEAISSAPSSD